MVLGAAVGRRRPVVIGPWYFNWVGSEEASSVLGIVTASSTSRTIPGASRVTIAAHLLVRL